MGGVLGREGSRRASMTGTKLECKITKAIQRRETKGSSLKSFNSVILKFPRIDESLRKCKATFEEFDEDGNGVIDPNELKRCFHKLEVQFSAEEIDDLFQMGNVSKNEMVDAINGTARRERSFGRIAMKRFEEMDWDGNGMVNFKELSFLLLPGGLELKMKKGKTLKRYEG